MPDTPQHAIRDGLYRVIYVTGNGGLYKYFPDTGQIMLFKAAGSGGSGKMAGYLSMGVTVVPVAVEALLGLSGAGTSNGVYHAVPDGVGGYTFTLCNSGLPTGRIDRIIVNPTNLDEWIVMYGGLKQGGVGAGHSALHLTTATLSGVYITVDGGSSFTPLVIPPVAGMFDGFDVYSPTIDYTGDSGLVIAASLSSVASLHVGNGTLYWYAPPASAGAYSFVGRPVNVFGAHEVTQIGTAIGGDNGDGVISYDFTNGSTRHIVGWWSRIPTPPPIPLPAVLLGTTLLPTLPVSMARSRASATPKEVVMISNTGTGSGSGYITSDYTSNNYSTLPWYGDSVASLADGSWWFTKPNTDKIVKVTNIASGPPGVEYTVAVGGVHVGQSLCADPKGLALAMYLGGVTKSGISVSSGGSNWVRLTPPVSGGTFDQVYGAGLAVIVR